MEKLLDALFFMVILIITVFIGMWAFFCLFTGAWIIGLILGATTVYLIKNVLNGFAIGGDF